MVPLLLEPASGPSPESLVEQVRGEPGAILLRSLPACRETNSEQRSEPAPARYPFVTARPFLTFRSTGSCGKIHSPFTDHASRFAPQTQFGNPWTLLDRLLSRYELFEAIDLPFPLGGCFGYWGYDLKNFVEP